MKNLFTTGLIVAIITSVGCASENIETGKTADRPKIELLWPDGAPGARANDPNGKPTITIYLPSKEKASGAAVVICPGGGYWTVAIDHEGWQIAEWLNSLGIAGFVVNYRNHGGGYLHPAPIQDAQRAIRTVRSRAKEFNIDPNKIGIIGFSAGGHLASTAGTHFNERFSEPKDAIDQSSARPDFMILVYPVITFTGSPTHKGSGEGLFGRKPDAALLEAFSNEKQVTRQTPPTFLVHSDDDKVVPSENSVLFYLALRENKVPAEMHIYKKGGHGYGLGKKGTAESSWLDRCAAWMTSMGLCSKN